MDTTRLRGKSDLGQPLLWSFMYSSLLIACSCFSRAPDSPNTSTDAGIDSSHCLSCPIGFCQATENTTTGSCTTIADECGGWLTCCQQIDTCDDASNENLPTEIISPVPGDDTPNLQAAIERATALPGGGRIILKLGRYSLRNVILRSNVHLEIEAGSIIYPSQTPANITANIFVAGLDPGPEIQNISVVGIGGRFAIEYPPAHTNPTRSFIIGNVNNFLIHGFDIVENYTKYSAIAFVLQNDGYTDESRAKNITVSDVTLQKSLYGYGLVQANAGENMLFKNLKATDAGVTLRVEADLEINNRYNIGVDNISAQGITCVDGHAAVFLLPHSIRNGMVRVSDVFAHECGVGVYIRKNMGRFPTLPDGSFASGSFVKNINVTYGEQTPVTKAKIAFMPETLRLMVSPQPEGFRDVYRRGPTAAAVVNLLPSQVKISELDLVHSGPNQSVYVPMIVTKVPEKRPERAYQNMPE